MAAGKDGTVALPGPGAACGGMAASDSGGAALQPGGGAPDRLARGRHAGQGIPAPVQLPGDAGQQLERRAAHLHRALVLHQARAALRCHLLPQPPAGLAAAAGTAATLLPLLLLGLWLRLCSACAGRARLLAISGGAGCRCTARVITGAGSAAEVGAVGGDEVGP